MAKKLAIWGGTFLVAVLCSLTPTDTLGVRTAEAQGEVDAVEYGISLGLPRAWAYRVAWCESRYFAGAYNRWSGASGLFQFIPSTWRATPQGRAGMSPFDPYANAAAAAWLYRTYGASQWSCR